MDQMKKLWVYVLQLIFLLGVFSLVQWLGLRPRKPEYTLVDFAAPMSKDCITSGSAKCNQKCTILLALGISNRNRAHNLYPADILVTLRHRNTTVGNGTIGMPVTHQRPKSQTTVVYHVKADEQNLRSVLNTILETDAPADMIINLETGYGHALFGHKGNHRSEDLKGEFKIGSDGKISGKKNKPVNLRYV